MHRHFPRRLREARPHLQIRRKPYRKVHPIQIQEEIARLFVQKVKSYTHAWHTPRSCVSQSAVEEDSIKQRAIHDRAAGQFTRVYPERPQLDALADELPVLRPRPHVHTDDDTVGSQGVPKSKVDISSTVQSLIQKANSDVNRAGEGEGKAKTITTRPIFQSSEAEMQQLLLVAQ